MTDAQRQEFWALLSLKHAPGLGARTSKRILECYGTAAKAVERVRSWKERGLATSQQMQGVLGESWRENAEKELSNAEERATPVIGWSDHAYPQRLREIPDPPVFLYAMGDVTLLDNPGVAMVGSRECSRYGIELAHRIAMDLSAQGVTVISGLAYGIDREAHLGGLTGPGSSIAVMGTGPDLIYPATNRDIWKALAEKGLLLSEFPPGTKPLASNFPLRNRIISGISLGVLVVEATTKSGSLITARLAMEQGREVFAVPGPVSLKSYRGCHEIINKGAKLVHGADDILTEIKPQIEAHLAGHAPRKPSVKLPEQLRLAPDPPVSAAPKRSRKPSSRSLSAPDSSTATPAAAKPKGDSKGTSARVRVSPERAAHSLAAGGIPSPAPESGDSRSDTRLAGMPGSFPASSSFEEDIAGHLAAMGASHMDALCRAFGKDASEMSRVLVLLELKGVVRRLPGGYYLNA